MPKELGIWEGEVYPVVEVMETLVVLQLPAYRRLVHRDEVILLTEFLKSAGFTFWKGYDDEVEQEVQPKAVCAGGDRHGPDGGGGGGD